MTEFTRARTEDREELLKMADAAFGTPEHPISFAVKIPKLYAPEVDTMDSHYIAREDGKIAAAVGSFSDRIQVGDEILTVRGIGTVSVDYQARSKGYMRKLMEMAVSDMEQDRVDWGFLSGQRQRYEYFSFTPAGVAAQFQFTSTNARHIFGAGVTHGYTFVPVAEQDSEVLDQMKALHDQKPVHVLRTRELFYKTLCSWYFKPMAVFHGGEFCGYLTVREENLISEIELTDMTQLIQVLSDYLCASGQEEVVLAPLGLYDTEKVNLLSRHAESLQVINNDNMSVFRYDRVVRAFLKVKASCHHLMDGAVTLKIEGRQTIRIQVKNQQVLVEETNAAPDFVFTHLEAMQLLFGTAKLMGNLGFALPDFMDNWFPLPMFYPRADNV